MFIAYLVRINNDTRSKAYIWLLILKLDGMVNCLCAYAQFNFGWDYYRKWCGYGHRKCMRCCVKVMVFRTSHIETQSAYPPPTDLQLSDYEPPTQMIVTEKSETDE